MKEEFYYPWKRNSISGHSGVKERKWPMPFKQGKAFLMYILEGQRQDDRE